VSGAKGEKITGGRKKLNTEQLHDFYFLANNINILSVGYVMAGW
jgi:hypothetical protein